MPATDSNLPLLDNESGFVLVLSLLILMVLVIIGIGATKDSQLDLLIARNDKLSKQNFYMTEAVVAQAAQTAEDTPADILKARTLGGLFLESAIPRPTDMTDSNNWAAGFAAPAGWNPGASYLIVDKGIAAGGSMDMSSSQLHRFDISGRLVDISGNTTIISIGYRKRF